MPGDAVNDTESLVPSPVTPVAVGEVGAAVNGVVTASAALAEPEPIAVTARRRTWYVVFAARPPLFGTVTGDVASTGLRAVHDVPSSSEYS